MKVRNLHQQIRETVTRYFTVILPNTMISFWNISTASAPIQPTEARVKYWMNSDMMVQPASVSVRSIPTRKNSSIPNMAMLSCMWNLLASRWRSFLDEVINTSYIFSNANIHHCIFGCISDEGVYLQKRAWLYKSCRFSSLVFCCSVCRKIVYIVRCHLPIASFKLFSGRFTQHGGAPRTLLLNV